MARSIQVMNGAGRVNSVVRRGFRERAKALVMEAIFYKADISNSDLLLSRMKGNILMNELIFGTAKNAVYF